MKTLAIDCATEACSAALFDGDALIDGRYEVLGRGHAERLVPMIAELPDKGRADRILVSLGPGSFTGVRIGIAAARALGLAWGAKVLGYPTLGLVAAMARESRPGKPVTVCMNGGHGEWFVQDFDPEGIDETAAVSLKPDIATDRARSATDNRVLAGNRAAQLADLLGSDQPVVEVLPDARKAILLREALLGQDLTPIYGRGPDAKPQAARR